MNVSESVLARIRRRLGEKIWIARALTHRKFLALIEGLASLRGVFSPRQAICVVSCERHASAAALKCLDSVYRQSYDRRLVRHVFIDDASDDGTHELILRWLEEHPDNNVHYIRQQERKGGTYNTLLGFRLAEAETLVVELNGDDWLAGRGTLAFLNRVYADPGVWMTYNTLCYENGFPALWARPIPEEVLARNGFREMDEWMTSAPHTFRRGLFNHLHEETFRDPETGDYWESADDQAIYLAMLELAGRHARHLYRVTYVYNFRESSHCFHGSDLSRGRACRVRLQAKYRPLESL
jgi:glycosyltransferase involved in cell wall biosynthesis